MVRLEPFYAACRVLWREPIGIEALAILYFVHEHDEPKQGHPRARPSPLEFLAECGVSADPCVEGGERGSEPGAFFRSSMGKQPSDVSVDVAKEAAVEADRSGQLSATRELWAP